MSDDTSRSAKHESQEAAKAGITVTALHYADLTANPRGGTAQLLAACGLGEEHLSAGLRGFERDAHSGSATANSVPAKDLSNANLQQVADCLARWGQPDLSATRLDLGS